MNLYAPTDGFTTVDAVLWSLAVGLLVIALWVARPRPATWRLDVLFRTALAALRAPWSPQDAPPPAPLDHPPEVYDARERVGAGADWAAVGRWEPKVAEAVRRRGDTLRVVWLEEPTVTLPPEIAVTHLSMPPGDPLRALEDPAFAAALRELAARKDLRVAWLATKEAAGVFKLLASDEGVRDLTRLVLLVGADLADHEHWLAEHFTHRNFDLEQARRLPFLTLRVEGAGAQRLRPPPEGDLEVVEIVDLGLLPREALEDPAVGRALAVVLAASEAWT